MPHQIAYDSLRSQKPDLDMLKALLLNSTPTFQSKERKRDEERTRRVEGIIEKAQGL